MVMIQCFSTGSNVGFGSGNLAILPAVTLTDSFLFAGGSIGTRQIRVTNNGVSLTNNGSLSFQMGDGNPRSPTNDFALFACRDTNDQIFEVLPNDDSDSLQFTTGFSGTCEGTMFPINGFKGAYYLNEGIGFYDSTGNIASFSGGVHTLGTGTGRDVFSVNGNNIIASNGNSNRYIFNPSTNNATFSVTTTPTGANCNLKGSAFIATDQVLYLQICTSGRNPELRVNNLGQTSTNSVINLTQSSTTYGTLEYLFPFAYVIVNNAGNVDLLSFEIISNEALPGINKKPVITNVRPETGTTTINQAISTFYDVVNPETATLNENILTTNSCSYAETENFLQDFSSFNFSVCGQAIIGTRKGVTFGNGLDLTQCSNAVISAGGTYTANMIVSFDVFATVDSSAQIELLQSDGSTIQTLTLAIENNRLSMIAGTQLILENISILFSGQQVPTRIFIQMNPTTTNGNLVNRIAYSTNYFSRNDDIRNTFCDSTEFCYIGNFISTSNTNLNDFTALFIDTATGDMAIDNLRVVTTPEYPIYTSTTTLNNLDASCNFDSTGVKINRIYASDTVYGHNYLSHTNVTYTINQQGVIVVPAVSNTSVGALITGIVAIGGFKDDGSLLLLSLIFLVSASVGMYFSGLAGTGVIFIDALLATLFFFLGWIPLSVYVIVVLLAASLVSLSARNLFIGGGTE